MPSSQDSEINIEEFYLRYGPMVLRRCIQLLRDEEKAKDATQEVFAKLLLKKKQLKGQYPSSLLFRISTNICLNMLRKHRKSDLRDSDATLKNAVAYDDGEKKIVLQDLLRKLFRKEKPSTSEIVIMHFVDGMTLQEVADEIGLSVSGVRRRIREFRSRAESKREIYNDK
ncbi:MAG: sigma-70 family RNA polymerase sigma factor [Candidatus Aminicenantes bacterium]|nr:sigma-70 family RNA polymerase sigma factor [Candidatus Aminicenantes bacterium]